MSSCECTKPVIIIQGASGGITTLYTANGTLLSDRTVNANNNDLTFNMGTGIFNITGSATIDEHLTVLDGVTLGPDTVNPGGATTLWVSGTSLYIGDQNLSLKISTNPGNLISFGSDSGVFLNASIICGSLSNCTLDQLGDVTSSTPSSGNVLFYNGAAWTPKTYSSNDLSDVVIVGSPTAGQALVYSNVYSAFTQQDVFQTLKVSGSGVWSGSQQIISPDTALRFRPSGDLSLNIASNTVTFGFKQAITSLTYDSGVDVLSFTNESGQTVGVTLRHLEFACSDLSSCSISGFSDVDTAGASTGQVLTWNGSSWVPEDSAAFSCSSLSGCDAASLSDIHYPSAPTNGQALVWSTVYSSWIPQSIFQNFSITDGSASQTIANGNAITFNASGTNTLISVVATDTVRIGFRETITSLTYNSGTNTLSYTDENGSVVNLALSTGGGSFTCASLGTCSIDALSDVSTGGATSGQVLTWNGSNWAPANPSGTAGFVCSALESCSITALGDVSGTAPSNAQALVWDSSRSIYKPSGVIGSFTITDGFTSQTINNGNSVIFSAGGDLSVSVTATDTVTYSFNETLTNMTYVSGTRTLSYTDESGNITAVVLPQAFSCSMLSGCSVDALADVNTAGVSAGQFLGYNGSAWVPTNAPTAQPSTDANNSLIVGGDGKLYFNEATTSLTISGGNYLKFTNEDGVSNTINVCTMLESGCGLNSMSGVSITSPSTNQILRFDGAQWVNSNENVAGSYSFNISGGGTTQTINNGNTLAFVASSCINPSVSGTDSVIINPILAPAQEINDGSGNLYTFANAIQCTSQGLFAPCVEIDEPTVSANGTEKLIIRVGCGSTWNSYSVPWFDNIKRVPLDASTTIDGDPADVGVDLLIDGETGELFYHSDTDTYKKARGTYGYTSNTGFTAGVPKNITHSLNAESVIVQLYLSNIQKNDCTIEILTADVVRIITPTTGTYKVCILPVFPLV